MSPPLKENAPAGQAGARGVAEEHEEHAPIRDADAIVLGPFLRWPDGRINGIFEHTPPALEWFCAERLLAGRGHLFAGLGGSSKTRALYHLGVGAVTGRLPWDWSVSITGSAALFLTEDTTTQVHRVMHRMGAHLDLETRLLLVQRLRVYALAGRNVRLLELEGQRLLESAAYGWFMEQLDRLPKPLVFVGIDPALGISEGDELAFLFAHFQDSTHPPHPTRARIVLVHQLPGRRFSTRVLPGLERWISVRALH